MDARDIIKSRISLEESSRTRRQYVAIDKWLAHGAKGTIVAFTGGGKALSNLEPVLTDTGWKPIGKLTLEDKVYGSDGTLKAITGVYPQGVRDIYTITFSDGVSIDCDDEHLWEVTNKKAPDKVKVVSTKWLRTHKIKSSRIDKRYGTTQEQLYYRIRLPKAIEYTEKDFIIDPYLMGVILAEGNIRGVTCISLNNKFVKSRLVFPEGVYLNAVDVKDKCTTYSIIDKNSSWTTPNKVTKELKAYGLIGKRSYEKFIPKEYMLGSILQRQRLLAGLVEGDGYKSHKGIYEYSSSSEQLAKDTLELIRSLGIHATITSRIPTYTYKGVKKKGKRNYRVYINLNKKIKSIKSITYKGKADATCISIDSDDKLFIAKGYTLTHNTRIALEAGKLFTREHKNRRVLVVVPTIPLKGQWEKLLEAYNLNAQVYVVNTLANMPKERADLFILDECHRYSADTFKEIFKVVNYRFILGLTATYERTDGKQKILTQYAPVVDTITMGEAIKNGWTAPTKRYNLALELPQADQLNYNRWYNQVHEAMKFFEDFTLMQQCSYGYGYKSKAAYVAQQYGWDGRDMDSNLSPRSIHYMAKTAMQAMREYKTLLHNHPLKVQAVEALLTNTHLKTIIFNQTIESIRAVAELYPDNTVEYHSDVQGTTTTKVVSKKYKSEKAAIKFAEKVTGVWIPTEDGYTVSYTKTVKVSARQVKEEALEAILGSTSVRIISTGKSLEEGLDVPDLQLGINMSRSSSKIAATQKLGRVGRYHVYDDGTIKNAIFVEIYFKDTQDEKWVTSSQWGMPEAIKVEGIDKLIDFLDEVF